MAEERYTAIIIGAGPAGSTAAYLLAKAGLDVLLIEKGAAPGTKNMFGGRMYSHALQRVIPNFWEEAPTERAVVKEIVTFLTEDRGVSLTCQDENWAKSPSHSFTLFRAEFDAWLAAKAEEAGALVACGIRVDDLLLDNGRVVGVRAGDDELLAEVVIAADGTNSLMAQKAGLREELLPSQVAAGVKQVIELSPDIINERFQLTGEQGAACLLVGACTRGMPGGGFLYTNRSSVSLGLVVKAAELQRNQFRLSELLEDFKAHPQIAPLIQGGRVAEYSAHLVPETGWARRPELFGDGILVAGDAAGLVINLGYLVRGMDLAIASGEAAAKTVIEAAAKQDFSRQGLSRYHDWLKECQVWSEMETYRRAPQFLENPELYTGYPDLIGRAVSHLFTVNGTPSVHLLTKLLDQLKESQMSLLKVAGDAWKGGRSL